MERRPKTVFQLDSPFTTAAWPQVSSQDQETILELLCRLLSPIGQHRASHITKSKGKRSKKRKRQEPKNHAGDDAPIGSLVPPTPEISSFVAVGLSAITRTLQASSEKPGPSSSPLIDASSDDSSDAAAEMVDHNLTTPADTNMPSDSSQTTPPFSTIFVLRSSQPSILHAHLPQLVATASLTHLDSPAPRLVQLARGSDERICQALGLPRVSFIGLIHGAPHSKTLVDIIHDCVPELELPWLEEVRKATYLPSKVNAIETFASVPKKKPA